MPISTEAAKRMIPKQQDWLAKIAATCDRAIQRVVYKTDDDFGLMALCYLSKQIDHARSVNRLLGEPPSRDAAVIARSMLEGAIFLAWAARNSKDRASQWQEFSAVEQWRRMKRADEVGVPVTIEERREVTAAISSHGPRFFTPRAKKNKTSGNPLPDNPYWRTWLGDQVGFRQVSEETKSEELLVLYAEMSGSVHWGPGGFGNYLIQQDDDTVQYQSVSLPDAASAAGLAVLCLIQTASIVADHFGQKDFLSVLRRFHDEYDGWHGSQVAEE